MYTDRATLAQVVERDTFIQRLQTGQQRRISKDYPLVLAHECRARNRERFGLHTREHRTLQEWQHDQHLLNQQRLGQHTARRQWERILGIDPHNGPVPVIKKEPPAFYSDGEGSIDGEGCTMVDGIRIPKPERTRDDAHTSLSAPAPSHTRRHLEDRHSNWADRETTAAHQ